MKEILVAIMLMAAAITPAHANPNDYPACVIGHAIVWLWSIHFWDADPDGTVEKAQAVGIQACRHIPVKQTPKQAEGMGDMIYHSIREFWSVHNPEMPNTAHPMFR